MASYLPSLSDIYWSYIYWKIILPSINFIIITFKYIQNIQLNLNITGQVFTGQLFTELVRTGDWSVNFWSVIYWSAGQISYWSDKLQDPIYPYYRNSDGKKEW